MWWRILNWLRPVLALALLAISTYCACLSLMLADPGNFRTEGSPAGALMFVVWLVFPVIALGTGLAGLLLLFLRPSPPPPPPGPYPLPATPHEPPAPYAERIDGPEGSTFDLLCHGDLAVIWLRRRNGSGLRTHNAQWRGDPGLVTPFRAPDGSSLRLPRAWAISTALARRVAERYRGGDDWTGLLTLRETPPVPGHVEGDRARWDWLRQADSLSSPA